MNNYDIFIKAIHEKKKLKVKFNSKEKGVIERLCIPYDFGPFRKNINPNPDRYHMEDISSLSGNHYLTILPEQVININMTDESFDPGDYIDWQTNWFVVRDWGIYS